MGGDARLKGKVKALARKSNLKPRSFCRCACSSTS